MDEARTHLDLAHGKLERSVAAFREGRLLAAAGLLREVRDHQELARHRLQELAEKEARLGRTLGTNRELLAALEDRVRQSEAAIPAIRGRGSRPWPRSRRRRAGSAPPGKRSRPRRGILPRRGRAGRRPGRPRPCRGTLAPADRDLFAEAGKSVEAAGRELAAAGGLARHAAEDLVGDSPEIVRSRQLLEPLAAGLAGAREALASPHGDWDAVDAEADRIAAESARLAATLRGENELGEAAVAAIASAAATCAMPSTGPWAGRARRICPRPGACSTRAAIATRHWRPRPPAGPPPPHTPRPWRKRRRLEAQYPPVRARATPTAARAGGSSSGSSQSGGSGSGSSSSSYGGSSSGSGKSGW